MRLVEKCRVSFYRSGKAQRQWPYWTGHCGCNTQAGSRPAKGERPTVYDSAFVESGWYDWWKNSGQFRLSDPPSGNKRPFTICLPPPNVTGDLHVGHALTIAIEDVVARWRRMSGDQVAWIPGFDHAGIATQVVVEKQLMREKGLRRVDMKREDFIEECLRWKEKKIANIQTQLERLGASLDWSRAYYTMDKSFSNAVTEAFLRLHQRGLIFRAERLVNWCPYLKSTVSDIEVNKTTFNCGNENESTLRLPGRDQPVSIGRLFYVKYPLLNSVDEFLTVATTRLETIPADVALAVHPDDHRYAKYVGQRVRNPIAIDAKPIAIIADPQVDPSFGTGVLKVTPAHDWTDFEIGVRHGLPINVRCLTEEGRLNELCGPELVNLDRFTARERISQMLSSSGLLTEVIRQSQITLPLCSRTGDVIEPMLKQQWFLDCRSLASSISRALDERQLRVKPQFFETQWKHWLGLTGDWCLSRQLWWGHRIPAYRLRGTDEWYCGTSATDVLEAAKRKNPGVDIQAKDLEQDEDVLDTWFSSALVPLISSGWPGMATDLYPLSLMETGHDILIFWVTRMAMMGLELEGRLPFDEVLLHGIVFDKNGRKMSKSLGNVVDPLDVIDGVNLQTLQKRIDDSSLPPNEIKTSKDSMAKEFPEGVLPCGADALRFTLLKQDVIGEKLNLDVNVMLSGRKFCNKLWQAFNFMETAWNVCSDDGWKCDGYKDRITQNLAHLSIMDRWLLSRLSRTVDVVNSSLANRDFHLATTRLYDFAWFEFCDLYMEWTKFFLRPADSSENAPFRDLANKRCLIGDILYMVADVYARSVAPFMPFLAEELYGRLLDVRERHGSGSFTSRLSASVHTCQYPSVSEISFGNDELENQMTICKKIWDSSRSLRNEFGIPFRDDLTCVLFGSAATLAASRTFAEFITLVAKLEVNEYRQLDSPKADFTSEYIWKSVDENLLLAVKVKEADHDTVMQRLAVQMDRLKKRKREHESRRQKAEYILSANIRSRRQPAAIQEQVESLQRKIENVDVELSRLEHMYTSLKK